MTSHQGHNHDATPLARAACRKATADAKAAAPTYKAADNSTFQVGDQMFNYYDGVIVTVLEATAPEANGVIWFRTTGALLDGSRMCSLATARSRGWLKEV